MTKRTEKGQGTQGANGAAGTLGDVLTPLITGMTATRAHLLAWVQAQGLVALQEVFATEAEVVAGPKGRHQTDRTHHHWGRTATELTLGGRRIQVARPRVRSTAGQEAVLPSVAAWQHRDPLTARVLEQILLGVSTRGYAGSLEAGPQGAPSRGTSKSAVSRTLRGRLTVALTVQLAQRLEGLELLALFLDGVVVAGQTVIVVLGLTRDGEKKPLGLRLGSTENAVVCTELLQDLLGRGLSIADRVLCVIDGGKGLRKAVQDVLGPAAVIQRCQLHKARNLLAQVPKARQVYVRAMLRRAYRAASADAARRQLKALATWLEANGHVDAAASLREGLEETLTVLKFGLPPRLRRFFATTNCIENLIGIVRHVTRNVKRWRDGGMIRRWVGLALGRAAVRFRRIKGHRDLATLATALRTAEASEAAA
ncbi:MAG: IS256 family transposase [Candidatus Acidiferrales bacterium]